MTIAAMLRGVNLGPHHRIKMEPLRDLYTSLGFRNVRTLLQSGNVVFDSPARDLAKLAARLESAFETQFGFPADTFLRTGPDFQSVIAANPFAGRKDINPASLAVLFLRNSLDSACHDRLKALSVVEQIHPGDRELYVYYTNGMARPQLTGSMLDKALGKVSLTSRNWNTVEKLAAMTLGEA